MPYHQMQKREELYLTWEREEFANREVCVYLSADTERYRVMVNGHHIRLRFKMFNTAQDVAYALMHSEMHGKEMALSGPGLCIYRATVLSPDDKKRYIMTVVTKSGNLHMMYTTIYVDYERDAITIDFATGSFGYCEEQAMKSFDKWKQRIMSGLVEYV